MCFAVEQRPRTNEVRHVGNVNAESPVPIVLARQRDRVIEVPRVDRVDGDDRVAGQVEAGAERRASRVTESVFFCFSCFSCPLAPALRGEG